MARRRQRSSRGLALAALVLAWASACPSLAAAATKQSQLYSREGDVIILTDENFDTATATGVWLLDIFAPWCSHCQQMEGAWSLLATELKAHGIKVAKMDGTKQRVTLKRFGVTGFPSIYLLKGGAAWQYNGVRSVAEMKDFALWGHQDAPKLPQHKAPNSAIGRLLGLVYSLPMHAKAVYAVLKEDRGLSDTAIISGVLLLPVALGAVYICVLDALYTRQAEFDLQHEHYE